ncbi:DUF106 domain-containing protein [Halostella litorea]|uniref:DUF106 domain-containing protein n=1 Tax=Halostella litorea TaxID=2528831 RepID=UPI0010921584|nr:DUF106 domain-containing protein [Halostella litorea]
MARTAEKVESLIEEDVTMADALAAVRRETKANGGEVEWGDVRDDLTSGQWGRLIEKGVLVSGDEGFELADPEAVEEALEDDGTVSTGATSTGEGDDEEASWSQYDKLAGVSALALMVGYYYDPVKNAVGGTIDAVLAPLSATMPFYAVILSVAMITGLYSTLLQSNLMDMDKMAEYQERMKAIQEKQKRAKERGDDEALEKVREEQMEAMGDQMGMFKEQFRPMVWIFLLTIPFFLWMYWKIGDPQFGSTTVVMPMHGEVSWSEGIVGPMQAWIVWYFLCSMGFTQLIRKSLNLQTTPTN